MGDKDNVKSPLFFPNAGDYRTLSRTKQVMSSKTLVNQSIKISFLLLLKPVLSKNREQNRTNGTRTTRRIRVMLCYVMLMLPWVGTMVWHLPVVLDIAQLGLHSRVSALSPKMAPVSFPGNGKKITSMTHRLGITKIPWKNSSSHNSSQGLPDTNFKLKMTHILCCEKGGTLDDFSHT